MYIDRAALLGTVEIKFSSAHGGGSVEYRLGVEAL